MNLQNKTAVPINIFFTTYTLFIILLGLTVLYSATDVSFTCSGKLYSISGKCTIFKQFYFALVSLVIAILIAYIPIKYYENKIIITTIYIICVTSLLVVFFFPSVSGAHRWISIAGFTIQPGEFMKLSSVLTTAYFISRYDIAIQHNINFFLKALTILAFAIAPFSIQTDTGALVLISVVTIFMLFLAKAPIKYILSLFFVLALSIASIIIVIPNRNERFLKWWDSLVNFNPCYEVGSQLCSSFKAMQASDFFGVGLGAGIVKKNISVVESDLIMAVVFEELGVIGLLVIIGYFIYLIRFASNVYKSLLKYEQTFLAFLTIGIALTLCLQFLMNILGITGLIPIKGITVPFISQGVNSLIVCIISITLLLKIERQLH